jgi:hypothetical protein
VRIGLLTTSFPRWPGDAAGHFVHGFAGALAARGHTLEVLAPEPAESVSAPRWPGIELSWVPYLRPRSWQRTFYGAGVPDNLRSDPRAWLGPWPFAAALSAAVMERRSRWDALISHFGLPCGLIAGALRGRLPHLCVQHSADLHALERLPGAVGTRLAARIARGSSALWFVSERARAGSWLGCPTICDPPRSLAASCSRWASRSRLRQKRIAPCCALAWASNVSRCSRSRGSCPSRACHTPCVRSATAPISSG